MMIKILVASSVCFLYSFVLLGQVIPTVSGINPSCGNATGTVSVSCSPCVVAGWEDGTLVQGTGQTFTPAHQYPGSASFLLYNIPAPGKNAFRAFFSNADGTISYSQAVEVVADAIPVGGTLSTPSTIFQNSASGHFDLSGATGTVHWMKSDATIVTDTEVALSSGNFVVTQTSDFYAQVTNGGCGLSNSYYRSNSIKVEVYKPGTLSGPSTMTEGDKLALSVSTDRYSNIIQWEYSMDAGASWTVFDYSSYGYNYTNDRLADTHEITTNTKFRVLVNLATFGTGYTNVLDVAYVPYTQANPKLKNGGNFIRQQVVGVSGTTDPSLVDNLSSLQKREIFDYLDAKGRVIQTNFKKSSPQQFDIVLPRAYDRAGREVVKYLPFVSTLADGAYKITAFSDQGSFYANGTVDRIADDPNPFSSTIVEQTTAGRIIEQGNVGQTWQPGGGHSNLITYSNNAAGDVRLFQADGSSTGFYNANDLSVTQFTDEDQRAVVKFSDKAGRTVLSRTQLDELIDGVMVPWLETYFVYNESGDLKLQISPKGVNALKSASWALTSSILDQYVFQYVYDARGRVVEKKVPGKTWIYYCYDRFDRIVLLQDANTRSLNKWLFLKYDSKGRLVMYGLYSNPTYTTRSAMQTSVIDPLYALDTDPYYEDRGAVLHGYTNQSFPTLNTEIQFVNYYDSYDFDYNGTNDWTYATQGLANEKTPSTAVFGMTTGSKRLVLDGGTTWLYSYIFYDFDGRVIQTLGNNHLSATIDNLTTIIYDFEGRMQLMKRYQKAGAGKEATTITKYQYDNSGRQTSVTHSVSQPIGQALTQTVVWTNRVNIDGDASVVGKVSGNNNYWDAGASSTQSIPSGTNGYIEFTPGDTNSEKMVGLSAVDNGTDFNTINYAMSAASDGNIYIYEDGVLKGGSYGAYTTSDICRVERSGTNILYKKNGTVLRTSTSVYSGMLVADCSLMQIGASIKNSNIFGQLNSLVNLTASGSNLTKTAGVNGAWDAATFSIQSIPASTNGWVEFMAGEVNTSKIMGLSSSDGGVGNTTINYGFNAGSTGVLSVYENGVVKASNLGTYSVTDILRVERQGSTVTYKKNGTILYTSLTSSSAKLFADCSFYTTGASMKNIGIGIGEITNATYTYNELGQLYDKKLHSTDGTTFLQSVDYRYDISGKITSINNAQLSNDAVSNDDANDYFGMEFLYDKNESGLTSPSEVYYNGNISAIKWKGAGATTGVLDQKSSKFTYDKSNKLKTSTSQVYGGSAWTKEIGSLNENVTYDHNGNIQTLIRNQRAYAGIVGTQAVFGNETIDNLTYSYNATMGDQLSSVSDAAVGASAVRGFDNGSTGTGVDYTYDNNGNLTKDLNKNINSIVYNQFGKPVSIIFSDNRHIDYVYDAAGTKLSVKKYNVSNVLENTTDYVNEFIYENSVLNLFTSPEGRVLASKGTLDYQYGIADHLGNVRVVFSSQTPSPLTTVATFEYDAVDNTVQYENVNTSNLMSLPFANHTTPGSYVIAMNQNYKIGPSKSLSVFPGDKVDMEVWEYHTNSSGFGTAPSSPAAFVTAIAAAIGGASGVPGELGLKYTGVSNAVSTFGLGGNQGDSRPAAYLNYLLFDKDYNVIDAGYQLAPATTGTKQRIYFPTLTIKEPGYIYIYLSYEDASDNFVYFDDFKVTHSPTNIIQSNEYYPLGLQANTSWTRDNNANNFLYNNASEVNTTTGWYDLAYRSYDPAIGHFTSIDPLAEKYGSFGGYHYSFGNPIMFNDPTGAGPSSAHAEFNPNLPSPPDEQGYQPEDFSDQNNITFCPSCPKPGDPNWDPIFDIFINDEKNIWDYDPITRQVTYRSPAGQMLPEVTVTPPPGSGDWFGDFVALFENDYYGGIDYNGEAWYGTNFVGPGSTKNPYKLPDGHGNFLKPKDMVDAAAQLHDYFYYLLKADGVSGALLNRDVGFADRILLAQATKAYLGFYNGDIDPVTGNPISPRTRDVALDIMVAFGTISSYK